MRRKLAYAHSKTFDRLIVSLSLALVEEKKERGREGSENEGREEDNKRERKKKSKTYRQT